MTDYVNLRSRWRIFPAGPTLFPRVGGKFGSAGSPLELALHAPAIESRFVQLQCVGESAIQLFLFTLGERSNKMGEVLFHDESEEIATDSAVLRKAVIRVNQDFAPQTQGFAVHRRTDTG